jgi:hypothetical protein
VISAATLEHDLCGICWRQSDAALTHQVLFTTRPRRLLDLTNLRMLPDLFAGDFAYFIGFISWLFLMILIHVLLYYTSTNATHDTLILLMIHEYYS